ncbi:hypothetical protein C8R43DRAFT_1133149 [Mycena crocata]|nr:hypothetical protein C8R43DRAFT_1133149 [Mycena crocata]
MRVPIKVAGVGGAMHRLQNLMQVSLFLHFTRAGWCFKCGHLSGGGAKHLAKVLFDIWSSAGQGDTLKPILHKSYTLPAHSAALHLFIRFFVFRPPSLRVEVYPDMRGGGAERHRNRNIFFGFKQAILVVHVADA